MTLMFFTESRTSTTESESRKDRNVNASEDGCERERCLLFFLGVLCRPIKCLESMKQLDGPDN